MIGTSCRVRDQRNRLVVAIQCGGAPGLRHLIRIGGPDHVDPRGSRRQRSEMFNRLVRRAVLPQPDRVVGEEVDHRELHQPPRDGSAGFA